MPNPDNTTVAEWKPHDGRLRTLENAEAHWPQDRYLLGKGQLTTTASCSPNKSGDCPHKSQENPLGSVGTPWKKHLGNFLPEAEGLYGASGEISPRTFGKTCDGDRVPRATSNVHAEELSVLRWSPSHISTSLWDLNEITKNFHVWGF